MPFFRILLLACLVLASCSASEPEDSSVQLPARVVILDASMFADELTFCSRTSFGDVDSFYNPSKTRVAEIDLRLPEVSPSESNAQKMLSEYARQYIGVYRGNEQFVYINGIHNFYLDLLLEADISPDARLALQERMQQFSLQTSPSIAPGREYWRVRPFNVCDGKQAFWGVEFAVDSGTFSELRFNQ